MKNPMEETFNNAIEVFHDKLKSRKRLSVELEPGLDSNYRSVRTKNIKGKVYMAGKLFSDADQRQRMLEYKLLEVAHVENHIDREIFSPIYAEVNDKSKLPTALDIFNTDERELMESDAIFADLADGDIGVAMELGMVIHKDVKVYAYLPDMRIESAGRYEGIHVPYGYNQFVIGGLEKYFGKVYSNFNEALEAYMKDESLRQWWFLFIAC